MAFRYRPVYLSGDWSSPVFPLLLFFNLSSGQGKFSLFGIKMHSYERRYKSSLCIWPIGINIRVLNTYR